MEGRIPLVLLPGLLCDGDLWAHQVAHLGEAARPTVADLGEGGTIGALAGRVLDGAPDRFALAGLSMGGYVALEIVRRAPDRVVKLALLDTNARADSPEQTARRRALLDVAARGGFDRIAPAMLPSLVHPDRLGDAGLAGRLRDMAARIGATAFARQQGAIIGRPDSRPGLAAIGCPTLVLCGRQDAICPVELHAEIAGSIPGARLAVVEDCGHMSAMERPQAVTALLRDWLLYA
jgi:pimeloyl-ACP methyl ester carboxylesterase